MMSRTFLSANHHWKKKHIETRPHTRVGADLISIFICMTKSTAALDDDEVLLCWHRNTWIIYEVERLDSQRVFEVFFARARKVSQHSRTTSVSQAEAWLSRPTSFVHIKNFVIYVDIYIACLPHTAAQQQHILKTTQLDFNMLKRKSSHSDARGEFIPPIKIYTRWIYGKPHWCDENINLPSLHQRRNNIFVDVLFSSSFLTHSLI